MTILVDANLTPFGVEFLQSAGIAAVHWCSVGNGDAPDTELLTWAVEHDAAILTCDGDFSQMLALSRLSRPSVIYLRTSEHNPQGPGNQVIAACKAIVDRLESGLIVTINDRGTRLRGLPILITE
jgi:predicted nuclease of predicted toxin-antitoxin system